MIGVFFFLLSSPQTSIKISAASRRRNYTEASRHQRRQVKGFAIKTPTLVPKQFNALGTDVTPRRDKMVQPCLYSDLNNKFVRMRWIARARRIVMERERESEGDGQIYREKKRKRFHRNNCDDGADVSGKNHFLVKHEMKPSSQDACK